LGKPYDKELEKLSEIYDWAIKTPITELEAFFKKSAKTPMYVIGSGGSFSATTFTTMLHQQIGTIARCLTPLEFLGYENIDRNCSILIITAGGNNKDILSSFDKAVELKPKYLGILCASTNNKLTQKASKVQNVFIHAIKLPIGKDGFLATNSLLATIIWITRAYIENFSLEYEIPNSLHSLSYCNLTIDEFNNELVNKLKVFEKKETIVLLYDNWGKTAAIDAESKLIESGLVNVQLADYRNFAHGRHNWLDKNKQKTGLIALVNPDCEKIASKTVSLIPEYIPTVELSTIFDGPIASLDLLVKILYTVKFFGKIKKIDPGRPQVASFGRKIYHLSTPKKNNSVTRFEKLALQRKFSNSIIDEKKIKALKNFIKNLENAKFGGVIFDYDGTLCNPENRFKQPSKEIGILLTNLLKNEIVIGIATGRGKSVRNELQKIIPNKFWPRLLLGYYNCADIGSLDDNSKPNVKQKTDSDLENFFQLLVENNIIENSSKVEKRPKQISIQSNYLTANDLIQKIQDLQINNNSIRIVESSHSIDILAPGVSKINLKKMMEKKIKREKFSILCIGDKGKWPGNDFDLLSTKFSLSVDEVSDDYRNCWNLLGYNNKGEMATLEYFKNLRVKKGNFHIYTNPRISNNRGDLN